MMLVQIRSSILGWNTSIFLQVNQKAPATKFYKYLGFTKMPSNNVTELPSKWIPFVNSTTSSIYIKFVNDETNAAESPAESHLHLFKCSSSIHDTLHTKKVALAQVTELLPKDNKGLMLVYPFDF